ncbi:hypothetical protein Acid345_4268 [Candidatus Koribacter versatilis Ellin345]|uniref:PD-(D/E)XK motif protein n=1 Tax=Koribacter versatilis (strain Ellin345) TaxID=204669 RepID=Q1IIN2_KORVE|nr:PD-(D/E)XK motif protein [Candidatus Koribacter versatilis]ABF43268.1 hypothetical protein Acid345_4268 [Candidatus Koribacter versatilis Ellin345]
MMTQLDSLWTELQVKPERPIFRRIDEVHPLNFYVGLDFGDERSLMLISETEPPNPPRFQALDVVRSLRGDGKWVVAIRLKRQDLIGPFARLCNDLTESTRSTRPQDGPVAVISHLARWKRLMELGRAGLSESEARGLIGELLFLESVAIPHFGAATAIQGWTGPSDAAQDFRLPGVVIEVKTCEFGSNSVLISSLDQLEKVGNRLVLVVTALSVSAENDRLALSLPKLVDRIQGLIAGDTAALEALVSRLQAAGFTDRDRDAPSFYRPEKTMAFDVTKDFPRLTRSDVPSGVLDAKYVLDLGTCQQFQCKMSIFEDGI